LFMCKLGKKYGASILSLLPRFVVRIYFKWTTLFLEDTKNICHVMIK